MAVYFGTYREEPIYDNIPAKDMLKACLFRDRDVIGGKRIVLAAHTVPFMGFSPRHKYKHRHYMCYALQTVDGIITHVVIETPGAYALREPWGTVELLDRQYLTTQRKFLVGCSLCGAPDMYRLGALKLCEAHKLVAVKPRVEYIRKRMALNKDKDDLDRLFERDRKRKDKRWRKR
jgi:hypothetical protein